MIQHAEQFAAAGIPFIFDPGQGLPLFGGDDLVRFVEQATWVTVNDYEWGLIQQQTGWTVKDVTRRVKALIITRGASGSVIHTQDGDIEIACAKPKAVVDPTGCGDAYRAGIIHGLLHGMDWRTTGQIASLMGAFKIERLGTQNHRFTTAEFQDRLRQNFGGPAS
jgi:adenosine kinase